MITNKYSIITIFFLLGLTNSCKQGENPVSWIEEIDDNPQIDNARQFIEERRLQEDNTTNSNDYMNFVYSNENGMVPDAKTAAIIGRAVIEAVTKEKCHFPLKVKLSDSLIWTVTSSIESRTPRHKHGSTIVYLKKTDAKVLSIERYK